MEMEEYFDDEIFDLDHFLAEILPNGSPRAQTSDKTVEQLETCDKWSSCSPEFSPSAAAFAAPLTSSGNSKISSFPANCNSNLEPPTPGVIAFSSPRAKDDSVKKHGHGTSKKMPVSAPATCIPQDHVMSERKRREHMTQLFIALSKVVPGLKKLDKISLLEDAINYLKALKEKVVALEKEEIKKKRSRKNDSKNEGSTKSEESGFPEMSVRILNKHVLVKLCSKKEMGLLSSRIPSELEKIHLSIIDMRIMPFGGDALDVTVLAQMQIGFGCSAKEIVDNLHAVF